MTITGFSRRHERISAAVAFAIVLLPLNGVGSVPLKSTTSFCCATYKVTVCCEHCSNSEMMAMKMFRCC